MMLFSSRPRDAPARAARFHLAAQRRDKSRAVARQRHVLAVHDIGLERRRLGDVERPQARPLVGRQRELVDDGNAEPVRDQRADRRAEAGADRDFIMQRVTCEEARP